MAIFRGVGGSGDSSDNSFLQAVTEQAEAAEASRLASVSAANLAVSFAGSANTSATIATTKANSILNLTAATGDAGTDASYNASTGVLTIPRGNAGTDATVTTSTVEAVGAVMDGDFTSNGFMRRIGEGTYEIDTNTYLTSFTEANNLSTTVTWANVPDANITQSSVTQHQAALSITESQISNLQSYLTTHQDITGKADLSGATFTGDVTAESKLIAKKYPVASDLLTTSRSIQDLAAWSVYAGTAANYALTPEKYRDALDVNQDNLFSSADSYGIFLFVSNNYTPNELSTFQSLLNNQSNITSTFVQDVLDGDYDTDSVIIDRDASSILTVEGDIDVVGNIAVSGTVDGVDVAGLETTVTGKADLSGADFTGGVGIGALGSPQALGVYGDTTLYSGADVVGDITVTGTVDGRDVATDGTKLDGLKGTLTHNYWDSLQWQQGASRVLTTTLTQYGDQQSVKHQNSTYKTYVDLSLDLTYNSAAGTNDAYGYLSVTAPPPTGETTVNMGTCTLVSSGVTYITAFTVVGDWTEYFSRYVGISKNSNGSNAMGFPYKWVYSPNANTTTVWVSGFGNPPSNGDTIYLHPFDWESVGTLINGEQLPLDNSSSSGVGNRRDFKLYLGRFYQRTNYRFQAKKIASSDVVTLETLRMTTTEYEA